LSVESRIKETIKESPSILKSIRQGVERECLRVNPDAHVAMSDHPKALGSKLTHPFITTDYSENLLEYITAVYSDEKELLD
jgi:glutamate--cysteine ligase